MVQKALADEATKKRITREFFAEHSVLKLADKSDCWLNRQGRLTEPMMLRRGAERLTHPFRGMRLSESLPMS